VNRRLLQCAVLVALASVVLWGVASGDATGDPALVVAERLACPVCDGESVAASQTDVARAMLDRIRSLQADGLSNDEVVGWFVARYGPEIDLQPPRDLGGILLRAVPVVALGVGVGVVARLRRASSAHRDPSERPPDRPPAEPSRLPTRTLAGIGVVAIALIAAAFGLGQFLQPRAQGTPVSGVIVAPVDLASISDGTLAATIAAFARDPDVPRSQLNGMRLALAERHFEAGNYRDAATVFREVLDAEPTAPQASEALGRLGWILWVNDEVDAAESAFERATEVFAGNGEARFFHAVMLLDLGREHEAIPLLEALVDDPSVPEGLVGEIEAMLAAARAAT
jgi:cytochrome c-type biogenesis protein CcmH/NrfF